MSERSEDIEELYRKAPQQLERPASRRRSVSPFVLLLCLLVGTGGGAVGALFMSQYLSFSDVFRSDLSPVVTVGTTRTRNDAFDRTALLKTTRALLALYPLRTATGKADDALADADRLGSALLLTDDGWAVTDASTLAGQEAVVAVTFDKKAYRVTGVTGDPASGLTYFRIAVTRAPTVEFASSGSLATLANAVALRGEASEISMYGAPVHIASTRGAGQGPLTSAETLAPSLVLDQALPRAYRGGVLADEKGRVTGIIAEVEDGTTRVWPSDFVTTVLNDLVKNEAVSRPTLGVTFVDLALTPGIADALKQNKKVGALLAGDAKRGAVVTGSAAAKAGLKSGDILLTLDKQALTEVARLPETLAALQPGATIPVTFLRAGEEHAATVTLGERGGNDE